MMARGRGRGGGGVAGGEESLIGWATPAAARFRFKTESRGGRSRPTYKRFLPPGDPSPPATPPPRHHFRDSSPRH